MIFTFNIELSQEYSLKSIGEISEAIVIGVIQFWSLFKDTKMENLDQFISCSSRSFWINLHNIVIFIGR